MDLKQFQMGAYQPGACGDGCGPHPEKPADRRDLYVFHRLQAAAPVQRALRLPLHPPGGPALQPGHPGAHRQPPGRTRRPVSGPAGAVFGAGLRCRQL